MFELLKDYIKTMGWDKNWWHFTPYIVLMIMVIVLRPGLLPLIGLFSLFSLVSWLLKGEHHTFLNWVKNQFIMAIVIALIYYGWHTLGIWGVVGFVAMILIVSGWILWKNKASYMKTIRFIETRIWGKPLDKNEWSDIEKAEMKEVHRMRKEMKEDDK